MNNVSCQKPVPPESFRTFVHDSRCGAGRDQRSSDPKLTVIDSFRFVVTDDSRPDVRTDYYDAGINIYGYMRNISGNYPGREIWLSEVGKASCDDSDQLTHRVRVRGTNAT